MSNRDRGLLEIQDWSDLDIASGEANERKSGLISLLSRLAKLCSKACSAAPEAGGNIAGANRKPGFMTVNHA